MTSSTMAHGYVVQANPPYFQAPLAFASPSRNNNNNNNNETSQNPLKAMVKSMAHKSTELLNDTSVFTLLSTTTAAAGEANSRETQIYEGASVRAIKPIKVSGSFQVFISHILFI
jgi:hypothetical protein